MTKRIGAAGFTAAAFFTGVFALAAFFVACAFASVAITVAAAMVMNPIARRAGARRSPNVMVSLSVSGGAASRRLLTVGVRVGMSMYLALVPRVPLGLVVPSAVGAIKAFKGSDS